MEQNQILIEMRGEVTILNIKGDITSSSKSLFEDAYQSLPPRADKILLQFDSSAYINSGGIAVLIQMLAETRRKNQLVGITGISDHFQKIFKMVGITKLASIYPSLEGAAEGLSG
jgi:anti-anti-sigma factor